VGAGSRTEGNVTRRPRGRVEPSDRSGVLGRVPDGAVRGGRDIVRVRPRGDAVLPDGESRIGGLTGSGRQNR
jgi:hypothetical protein